MSELPWLRYAADPLYRHRTALITAARSFSWQELALAIDKSARDFQAQGMQAGQLAALCSKNSLEALLCYLAILQQQGRVLGINPAFSAEKRRQLYQENGVAVVFDEAQGVFACSSPISPTHNTPLQGRPLTLTLTSGSSGSPKAVVHDIAAHLDNARGVCALMAFDKNNCWLLSLPLFHVSGQGIVWRWLLQGATLRLPHDDFYAAVLQSSHVSLVPTQAQRLLAYLAQHPDSPVQTRHILLGGTRIAPELGEGLAAYGIQAYSGYGMTEMASTVCAKKTDRRIGVGQPLAGREYRLVNGEIWLRGAGLGLGYWMKGQTMPLTNAQGWLQTKDRGQWLDGELVIAGRLDNMFISGGENIQPEEIEALLHQHPDVEQAVVLPIDDPEFGQRPAAMVAFRRNFNQGAVNNLQNWLSDKLEKFKQPVAYFALPQHAEQGIKLARAALKTELNRLVGKNE